MRYKLCIRFLNSPLNFPINNWDWTLEFKTLRELTENIYIIDHTVKKAIIFDDANKTFRIIKE